MKKILIVVSVLVLVAVGIVLFTQYQARGQIAATLRELETEKVRRGDLKITVGATGDIRANQTALLTWQTTGTVGEVDFGVGNQVSTGQIMASLEGTSLPQHVILARAELIDAQKALDDLLFSQTQQAQARKAVEKIQQDLEDALNPELTQAHALEAIAAAQKSVDQAQMAVAILKNPVSQSAKDQAYANMLLAEKVLNDSQEQVDRIERKLNKPKSDYKPWESQSVYRKILKGLNLKLAQDQIKYEESVKKYNNLLKPANPNDLAVAETALALAQAQLAQAEREWERVKDGPNQAEVAVLEAQLEDAQREWERWKDGPNLDEIAAAEARIAAAQALLNQIHITAPMDGVITNAASNPGDQVNPGTLAFRIDDLSFLVVDVLVSEVDINRIRKGQAVLLTFDSILAKEYHGEVLEVPAVGEVAQGVTNFNVQVEITDADEQIKPGMTSSVTFVVDELANVLLVPSRSVRTLEGRRIVYIAQNGQLTPIDVILGKSSDTYSQVLESTLLPGDEIVLNPSGNLPERRTGFEHPSFIGD